MGLSHNMGSEARILHTSPAMAIYMDRARMDGVGEPVEALELALPRKRGVTWDGVIAVEIRRDG